MSPLHSRGSLLKGSKIRIVSLSHAFSGAQKLAEVLCHPCILAGPQKREAISELAASAMPSHVRWALHSRGPQERATKIRLAPSAMASRGPKSGLKCYVTPAFLGVPNKGEQNQNWVPQPCLLERPKVGGTAMSPLHSRGSPIKGNKIRIGCLSHAFWVAQKWVEVLRHPCILGVPHQRGAKSELAVSPMPSQGPQSRHKCYASPGIPGVPNKGKQNQNWLPQPCLLGGPKLGRSATSPLHSEGSQTKGNKI